MRPTTGIVAFLDILGYKSFLAHTKIETATKLINEMLLTIPQDTVNLLHEAVVRNTPIPLLDRIQDHAELLERMIRLVFADTVFIAHPLTPTRNPFEFTSEILPFLATVSLLMRRFFDGGLPLRGGIALGAFVVEGYCFAGDAIVKAYEAGSELEFAGCAFEDETRRAIVGAVTHSEQLMRGVVAPPYRRLTFAADVPCKGGPEAKFLVRWLNPFVEWGDYPQDVDSYVAQAFSAHGKSIDDRAQKKLKNTISVLESARFADID